MLDVKVNFIVFGGVKEEIRYIAFEELPNADGVEPEIVGMQLLEESTFIYNFTVEPIEVYEKEARGRRCTNL